MSSVYGLPKAFIKKKFWQQQLNSFSCSKFQNVLNCQNLTKCAKCNGTMTTIKQICIYPRFYPRLPKQITTFGLVRVYKVI